MQMRFHNFIYVKGHIYVYVYIYIYIYIYICIHIYIYILRRERERERERERLACLRMASLQPKKAPAMDYLAGLPPSDLHSGRSQERLQLSADLLNSNSIVLCVCVRLLPDSQGNSTCHYLLSNVLGSLLASSANLPG